MRHIPQATAAMCLAATGALAQGTCPTAADLGGGIALTRVDPFYSNVMTRTDDGLAEARILERDGVPEAVSSMYSHGLTTIRRDGGRGVLELVYGDDTMVLDRLPQIGSWITNVSLISDGEMIGVGTFAVRYLESFPFDLGECSYETWQVRTTLSLEGRDPMLMDRYFSPVLGISLASVTLDVDGNPVSSVIYDQIEDR